MPLGPVDQLGELVLLDSLVQRGFVDQGVQGHAFLGSAMRGAHLDGQSLIQFLKPTVVGQDPLDRERLYQALWKQLVDTRTLPGAHDGIDGLEHVKRVVIDPTLLAVLTLVFLIVRVVPGDPAIAILGTLLQRLSLFFRLPFLLRFLQ